MVKVFNAGVSSLYALVCMTELIYASSEGVQKSERHLVDIEDGSTATIYLYAMALSPSSSSNLTSAFSIKLDPLRKLIYDDKRQFAYLGGRSTTDVHKAVCSWASGNKNWALISIDYTNAFGELDREKIFSSLRTRNVNEAYI
ncbi:hypothetical protein FOZ63_012263, partial [Perkinsus olseni]